MLKRKNSKLVFFPDVSALAAALLVLMVVYLVLFLPNATSERWLQWDPFPSLKSAVKVPNASREDALVVIVMKDGSTFFNCTLGTPCYKTDPKDLPAQIQDALRQGGQHKVHIKADARVKYGCVKEVLDAVQAAGIQDINFITGADSGPFTLVSD